MHRGYDSAGVSYSELEVLPDFTGVNTLSTGIVGGATRGPTELTKVTSAQKFRKLFGNPVQGDWGVWAALKVLKNSNCVWYKRIVGSSAAKGVSGIKNKVPKYKFETKYFDESLNGATITVTKTPGSNKIVKTVGEEQTATVARGVTREAVDAEVTRGSGLIDNLTLATGEIVHDIESITQSTTVYHAGTDFTWNKYGVITWVEGHGPEASSTYIVELIKAVPTGSTGDDFVDTIIETEAGVELYSVERVYREGANAKVYTLGTDYTIQLSTGKIAWKTGAVDAPGIDDDYCVDYKVLTSSITTTLDRYNVVLARSGVTIEKLTNFTAVESDPDYIVTALKERSDYLDCEINGDYSPTVEGGWAVLNGVYTISGGNAGLPNIATDVDKYIGTPGTDEGLQAFRSAETLDISTLIVPGVSDDRVIHAATEVAESRGEIMYIPELPQGLTPQQADKFARRQGDWTPTLSNNLNLIDSKFVAMYYPWVLEYVPEFGKNVYTPASAWVASQFAYNDTVAATWFAPAGFQEGGITARGVLSGALGLEHQCTKDERDLLYADENGCVNPICGFVGHGITIWGNKTALKVGEWDSADSSWTQVSVRRMCNYIRKVVTLVSMKTLFQPNTQFYRDQWVGNVSLYLEEIKQGQGIEAYKVICDDTTVSEEDKYYGRMPGKIYVKPVHSIEWIPIDFIVTHDSVIFSETTNAA